MKEYRKCDKDYNYIELHREPMKIENIINHDIEEFKIILNKGFFSKDDIEELLKNNLQYDHKYINEIAKYINKKYNDEINLSLELAKYYLKIDVKKSIQYLENYKINGGKNQDALMLLMKLYRDIGDFQKAINITENINYANNREKIQEIFGVCIKLIPETREFKQKFKKIIRTVDEYENNDREELLKYLLNNIFKQNQCESFEIFILTVFNNFKNLDNKNKRFLENRIIKYYLKLYIDTANIKFMNKISDIIKLNHKTLSFLFNAVLKLKIKKLNFEKTEEIKSLLKIFKNNNNILTDLNKSKIIDVLLLYYNENKPKIVSVMCDFMSHEREFDEKLSKGLALALRKDNLNENDKNSIIKILKANYKKNKNIKYKNIFLNEIEILQNKVVLKSKPRTLIATLTTKCNLHCIICNGINHNPNQFYDLNHDFYDFIVENMPYLEEVIWQGGEVFLYDKFKYLAGLAYKHDVKQKIITNALLLNEDLIKMVHEYSIDLQISIDAVGKQIYEEIRVGAKYENLLEKLEQLKKYKTIKNTTLYSLEAVIISKNFNQLEDLVKFAISYKFNQISFLKYITFIKDSLVLSAQQINTAIEKINMLRKKYTNIFIKTNIDANLIFEEENKIKNVDFGQISNSKNNCLENKYKTKKQLHNNLFCVSPWTRIYLDCGKYIRITCLSNRIDVNQYKYNEIWNCKELIEYREKIRNNDLSDCNFLCRNCGEYSEKTKLGIF